MTLYFNNAVDGLWATLGNWWQNEGATIPASSIPTASDTAVILLGCTIDVIPANRVCSENRGTITDNLGTVTTNTGYGVVVTNENIIVTNDNGTVTLNGTTGSILLNTNSGAVITNDGSITLNEIATVTTNSVTGTVTTNAYEVMTNDGTVGVCSGPGSQVITNNGLIGLLDSDASYADNLPMGEITLWKVSGDWTGPNAGQTNLGKIAEMRLMTYDTRVEWADTDLAPLKITMDVSSTMVLKSSVATATDVKAGTPRWVGATGVDVGTRGGGVNGSGILGML